MNGKIIFTILAMLLLSACAELQPVRTTPDFVTTAIRPGDEVELVTSAGDRLKFEVTHVDESSIGSPEHLIALEEIDELYLLSKERPRVPCGGTEELGCSVPGKAKAFDVLVSEVAVTVGGIAGALGTYGNNWHSKYEDEFYYACLQHDFCYRHGHKTYGHEKETCDTEFYNNMIGICGDDIACRAAAREFRWAVTEHADEGAYRAETSTYCEYDGPPLGKKITPGAESMPR